MRRCLWGIVLLIICCLSVNTLAAPSQEQASNEPVFMGLYWGDSLDALGEVKEASRYVADELMEAFYGSYYEGNRSVKLTETDFSNLSFKLYIKETEIKSLGTVPVNRVVYGFINGKLAMIHIVTPNVVFLKDVESDAASLSMLKGTFDEGAYQKKLAAIADIPNQLMALVEARYGKLSYKYSWSQSISEVNNLESFQKEKVIGDTYVGSIASFEGVFHLHSVSLFAEAKAVIEARKKEKEAAYEKRLKSESKLW